MRYKKLFSGTLATLIIAGQFGLVAAAGAANSVPVASAPPAVSESPVPSPSPLTSPVPSPAPTPEPSGEPTPSVTPSPKSSPAASASPSPTASPEATPSPAKKKSTDVGPDGCGGVVPDWVFDTAGQAWVAADKKSFNCDKASGYYLSPKYYFDKRIGWYEIVPTATTASKPDYLITAPNLVHTVLGDLTVGSQDYQMAKALGLLDSGSGGILTPAGSANIGGTGAGSNNQVATTNGGNTWFDFTNLINVINMLQSNATTGSVNANKNTAVGNSSTGAASVVANLINLLASAWSWSSGDLNFFMRNITAPETGDINLNPTQLSTTGGGGLGSAQVNGTGTGSNNTVNSNNPSSLNVNAKNSGNIVNNVNVNALSGDANASKNTSTGDVATGNAMAQVNIINLINSFITSGSSFFGILNIMGSLNGDILFPTGFLNGLLPAGSVGGTSSAIGATGASSNNQIGQNNTAAATVNNTSSNAVTNNIATTAASGAAKLDANTSVGNVGIGTANTNQSLFNIANSSIFGDNAVLVMVNVLGHWVGKLMSLPSTGSSQSALLTGNATVSANGNSAIANTGADSNNQINADNSKTANINQNSTGTITNNIKVNAQSGDANLTKNTKVGDVATGNAQADSSVANIFNTVLNVKHWFGVLVINVFGDWVGDVNHDSAAGGYSTAAGRAEGASRTKPTSSAPVAATLPSLGLLSIVKPLTGTISADNPTSSTTVGTSTDISQGGNGKGGGKVLTAAARTTAQQAVAATQSRNMSLMFILSAIVMLIAGALATIDKKLKR